MLVIATSNNQQVILDNTYLIWFFLQKRWYEALYKQCMSSRKVCNGVSSSYEYRSLVMATRSWNCITLNSARLIKSSNNAHLLSHLKGLLWVWKKYYRENSLSSFPRKYLFWGSPKPQKTVKTFVRMLLLCGPKSWMWIAQKLPYRFRSH